MKKNWGFFCLVIGLLLLTACQGGSIERLWLNSPDWSRAQAVGGMGIPDPSPFVVDESGHTYFLFIDGDFEALQAEVVAFDSQAEPLWSHTFNDIIRLPDDPQLVWDGNLLHAFWVSSGALYTARLDINGDVVQEPTVLSGDIRVDSYSVASTTGKVAVWFAMDRREGGLYEVDMTLSEEPALIDEEGVIPTLRFDQNGNLHAIWAHHPRDNPRTDFLYGTYDSGSFVPNSQTTVYETSIPLTADLVGPTLGIDTENVYIYWVQIFRTGLEAGFTESRYITFPQSMPEQVSEPRQIFIPGDHDLNYEPFPDGWLNVGERYLLGDRPSPSLSVLQDVNANRVQEKELAIGFRASIDYYWRRSANQIGLAYLQNGMPTSYQLLSFTQQPSTDPFLQSDSDGNLFVSWLETGDVSRFDVFFASTSSNIKKAFNPVTFNDITTLSAATIFGLLTGVLLAPIAAVLFLVLPMIVIGLTSIFRRGEQSMRSPGTIISFVLAIAAFQVSKYAAFPGMTDYVPFSAWLPLPDIVKAPLQIIVPVTIMIGAVWAAWYFTYRKKTQSPLYFMILYVAVDSLFSMAIYGVLFYGAF